MLELPKQNKPYFSISKPNAQELQKIAETCKTYEKLGRNLIYRSPLSNMETVEDFIEIINRLEEYGVFNLQEERINIYKFVKNYKYSKGIRNKFFVSYYLPYLEKRNEDIFQDVIAKLKIPNLLLYKNNKSSKKHHDGFFAEYNGRKAYVILRPFSWLKEENYEKITLDTCEGKMNLLFLNEEAQANGMNIKINSYEKIVCYFQGGALGSSPKIQKRLNKSSISSNVLYFIPIKATESAGVASTTQCACEVRDYLNKLGFENFQNGYRTRMFHCDEADLIHPANFPSGNYGDVFTFLDKKTFCLHKTPNHFIKKSLDDLDNSVETLRIIRMLIVDKNRLSFLIKEKILIPVE